MAGFRSKRDDDESDSDEDEDDDDEEEDGECVLKGKSTSLAQFFRVARNLMAMMFKNNPNHNPNAPSASALIQGTAGGAPFAAASFKEQELFDEFSVEVQEIEEEFWRTVLDRDAHVQVNSQILILVSAQWGMKHDMRNRRGVISVPV